MCHIFFLMEDFRYFGLVVRVVAPTTYLPTIVFDAAPQYHETPQNVIRAVKVKSRKRITNGAEI